MSLHSAKVMLVCTDRNRGVLKSIKIVFFYYSLFYNTSLFGFWGHLPSLSLGGWTRIKASPPGEPPLSYSNEAQLTSENYASTQHPPVELLEQPKAWENLDVHCWWSWLFSNNQLLSLFSDSWSNKVIECLRTEQKQDQNWFLCRYFSL